MQKITLFLITVLCAFYTAQSKDLSGNWREIRRTDYDDHPIKFTDTIRLAFLTGNEYTWQKKKDFIYRGTFKYNGNVIDMGARFFTVLKHTDNRLIVKDENLIYEFESFTPAANERIGAEKKPSSVGAIADIEGKWNVYKRTSEKAMNNIDYSFLVEDVVVESKDGGLGYITSSSLPHQKDGWQITSIKDGTMYAEGKTKREFEVSKRGNELILKENGITYFLKKFKE